MTPSLSAKDPLLWAVRRLHSVLHQAQHASDPMMCNQVNQMFLYQRLADETWNLLRKAESRGWSAAAVQVADRFNTHVDHLHNAIHSLLHSRSAVQSVPPESLTLRFLLDELRQLEDEFGGITINPKCSLISVTTQPIRLEGYYLGRFRIELYLDRLTDHPNIGAFDCVAVDPQPASGDEEVTHPHVKSNALCAGEATLPLQAALRDGRIVDAFTLINSVLNTYNGGSAYVSLSDWEGISCGDCGCTRDREELYTCQTCESHFCDGCIGNCDICDESLCDGCSERDAHGDRRLCASCRTQCQWCRGITAEKDVDEAGLCPQCQQDDQNQSENQTQELTKEQHEHAEQIEPIEQHNHRESLNPTTEMLVHPSA